MKDERLPSFAFKDQEKVDRLPHRVRLGRQSSSSKKTGSKGESVKD